nr:translation initiation factor IF-2-like [Lytechinus pictus]
MDRRQPRKCKSLYAKVDQHSPSSIDESRKAAAHLPTLSTFYDNCTSPIVKRRRPSSEEDDSHWLLGQTPLPRIKPVFQRANTPDMVEDSKAVVQEQIAASTPNKNSCPIDVHEATSSPVKSGLTNSRPAKRLDSGIGSEISSGSETMDSDRWPSPITSGSSVANQGSDITKEHENKTQEVKVHDGIDEEHLQAMAGIELLRSRVKELKRTKLELERTKMELREVREEARRDMEEVERRAHINMTAAIQSKVDAVKEQAEKDVEAVRIENKAFQETLEKQAKKDREAMEKLASNQLETLRKQLEKELELEGAKAKKNEQAAVRAAEEKILRKMDSMQRKMQGKIDAAEKERKKAVEDIQRETKREVESCQRIAEQAVMRYNKLIAEYNVLEGRISDAARLLTPMNS